MPNDLPPGPGAINAALKKDRDACGFSPQKGAKDTAQPCPKHWIAFHVLDVTVPAGDPKKAAPVKRTRLSTKLPGMGDKDVLSAADAVKISPVDAGTASILQAAPPEELGWIFDSLESA